MATKHEEINNPNGCLFKAADDEPVFVLRAQDALAPNVVRQWANAAMAAGTAPEKVLEALDLAKRMESWPGRRLPT